jgi:trimeric autotransporter adhesin
MAVTTSRSHALTLSTDLAQAGDVFNDAQRLLVGGLFQSPSDNAGQIAYEQSFVTDIHAVLNDITADLAAGAAVTVGGTAYTLTAADVTALQNVETQLNTMLTAAPNSLGDSASAIAAQQTLQTADAAVLSDINGDSGLATALAAHPYASQTGAMDVGFEALPVGSDSAAALSAATAQGATLAQIGTVYNEAVDLSVGGLNNSNLSEFTTDLKAVVTGVQNILNSPTELASIESGETANAAALTTLHLETVEAQVNLQLNKFDGLYATNPNVADRSTNDNLLDIIDIVQNDANLDIAAGGNGTPGTVGGFSEMPAFLNGAGGVSANGGTVTQYQDNQAQTNFWAQFLAEANVIQNDLNEVAKGTYTGSISSLITQIENYHEFGASFDASQGGIFGARFDNELLSGTLLEDTNNAVQGLTAIENGATGTALAAAKAQITAAGVGFHDDANDVSGNNIPIGGGTYVGTATTVAAATSVNGVAQGTTNVGPVANGQTGLSSTATASTPPTMHFGGHRTGSGHRAGSGRRAGTGHRAGRRDPSLGLAYVKAHA